MQTKLKCKNRKSVSLANVYSSLALLAMRSIYIRLRLGPAAAPLITRMHGGGLI